MGFGLSHIGTAQMKAAIICLQGNLIRSINTFQIKVAGSVLPEKCRAKGKFLVTTDAEEKKIVKVHIKNPFLLPSLIAALGLILADRVAAQTFTTLHSFAKFTYNGVNDTNSDGVE